MTNQSTGQVTAAGAGSSSLMDWLAKPWAGVAGLFVFYIGLLVVFAILSPWFFNFNNLMTIASNIAFIGLMAATQTPLIIAGGLDLSVAAIAGLAGVVIALLNGAGVDIWVATVVALALGSAIGAVNGLLVTKVGINPLIATLGMMSVIEGMALVLTGGLTQPLFVPDFNVLGSGRLAGIPIPALFMLAVFLVTGWMLMRSPFGRFVYATGGNAEAARLVGVPVDRTRIILYAFSGFSGALSGVILAAMLGASAPTVASASLLTVIAAVILGGTSLLGGRGSLVGTLIAVFILGTLNNALVLLAVSSFWQKVTTGVVLLLAVGLDQLRTRALGD